MSPAVWHSGQAKQLSSYTWSSPAPSSVDLIVEDSKTKNNPNSGYSTCGSREGYFAKSEVLGIVIWSAVKHPRLLSPLPYPSLVSI